MGMSKEFILIGLGAFATAFFSTLTWMIFQKKKEQHESPCVELQLLKQRVDEHVRWYENLIIQIRDIHKNLELMRDELVKIRTQMELTRDSGAEKKTDKKDKWQRQK